jgi:molybdopterin converting factor subunit 1
MMVVKVLFFATIRERTGVKEVQIELPENSQVVDFKEKLVQQFPSLAVGMSSTLVAVNREFAFDDQIIPEDAELAVFPPVSGG